MIWVDAHLSPTLARWIVSEFDHTAHPVRDLGLREAKNRRIFDAARQGGAIILTKDADFPELVERLGPPPQVMAHLWKHQRGGSARPLEEGSARGS